MPKKVLHILIVALYFVSCTRKLVEYERIGYDGVYSNKYFQSLVVNYYLTKECSCGNTKRTNYFYDDSLSQKNIIDFYKGSGFDRGHLKPADHSKCDEVSMKSTFSSINISPQKPSFNRGPWKQLEQYIKNHLTIKDSIQISTGPIIRRWRNDKLDRKVIIPKAYYKAMKINDTLLVGFIMNQEAEDFNPEEQMVSINQIEKQIGINLYTGTSEQYEDRVNQKLIGSLKQFKCKE